MNERRFLAPLAVARRCWQPARTRAHARSTADIVIEWNQILQDTIPGAGGVLAPRFYSHGAHRDVRCGQRHRARVPAVSRRAARPRPADRRKPRRRRPRTTCSSPSTRRQRRPMMRRSPGNSAQRPTGIRSPRRGDRRPRRQGDPGVAAEGRLDGLAGSRRTPSRPARALAADAAEQPGRGVHASPARGANGAADRRRSTCRPRRRR